jgi:hypothetical protein
VPEGRVRGRASRRRTKRRPSHPRDFAQSRPTFHRASPALPLTGGPLLVCPTSLATSRLDISFCTFARPAVFVSISGRISSGWTPSGPVPEIRLRRDSLTDPSAFPLQAFSGRNRGRHFCRLYRFRAANRSFRFAVALPLHFHCTFLHFHCTFLHFRCTFIALSLHFHCTVGPQCNTLP